MRIGFIWQSKSNEDGVMGIQTPVILSLSGPEPDKTGFDVSGDILMGISAAAIDAEAVSARINRTAIVMKNSFFIASRFYRRSVSQNLTFAIVPNNKNRCLGEFLNCAPVKYYFMSLSSSWIDWSPCQLFMEGV